jgi:Holliday junction DNA helicase RuvA
MIAKLKGILDTVGDDWLIIDVQGVGYLVYGSARLLHQLPSIGESIHILIESVHRQEQIQLYGFSTPTDQHWFRLLLTVQGVGAKVALAIQSALSCDELTHAIVHQDKAMITRAEGVGPKLAGRIVAELKDRVGKLSMPGISTALSSTINVESSLQDAISALENLGYRRAEATSAVAQANSSLGASTDPSALIRLALSYLSSSILSSKSS